MSSEGIWVQGYIEGRRDEASAQTDQATHSGPLRQVAWAASLTLALVAGWLLARVNN